MDDNKQFDWSRDDMLEVTLNKFEDFLLVKETLTRVGIISYKNKTLFQSCHILHKRGKYYIVHFKELFELDHKRTNLTENDIKRRTTIAKLLQQWNLLKIVDESTVADASKVVSLDEIKILSFKEKENWNLVAKYTIGNNN